MTQSKHTNFTFATLFDKMALNRDVIIKKLMNGKCKRVAEKLGVAPSTVSMVNMGKRANLDISNALLEEEAKAYRDADRIIKEEKENKKSVKKGFLKNAAIASFFCLLVSFLKLNIETITNI